MSTEEQLQGGVTVVDPVVVVGHLSFGMQKFDRGFLTRPGLQNSLFEVLYILELIPSKSHHNQTIEKFHCCDNQFRS